MREYLLTMLAAAVVTYLTTPLVRRFAIAIGAMTEVRDRDVHAIPTPRLGGLAMFFGMAAGLVMAWRLPYLRSVFENSETWSALLFAGGLIVLVGIADDKWGVDAFTKFAGQVAAAGLLIMNGVQLLWIPLPNGETLSLPPLYNVPLTILIVVATMNAMNFIDGLDGLAAGVAGIGALAYFSYAYGLTTIVGLTRQTTPAMISALLVGLCFGFLPHNFSPARIFMGDTGSMLIGLLLSSSVLSALSEVSPSALGNDVNRFAVLLPLMIPAAVLVVPYIDMLLAVVRRTYDGRSPFAPDRKHLHHRLLDMGHSHRGAALVMYLWTAVFAFGIVAMSLARSPFLVLSVVSLAAVVALVLMAIPQLRPHRRRKIAAPVPDERDREPV